MTVQEAITLCKKKGYKIKNIETDYAVITKFGGSIILTIVISFIILFAYIIPAVIYIIYVMKRREKVVIQTSNGDIVVQPWKIKDVRRYKGKSRRWRAVGKVHFCLEQYGKAAESFERAISFNASDLQSLDYLAKCYEMGVISEQAESAYQKVKREKSVLMTARHGKSIARARMGAWIIDVIIPYMLFWLTAIGREDIQGSEMLDIIGVCLYYGHIIYFLIKDSLFGGRSIGKLIFRLAVVDEYSGRACTISQSFKRNLPLLVPIVPLIAAVQIDKDGKRIGEGWAGTKVISPI